MDSHEMERENMLAGKVHQGFLGQAAFRAIGAQARGQGAGVAGTSDAPIGVAAEAIISRAGRVLSEQERTGQGRSGSPKLTETESALKSMEGREKNSREEKEQMEALQERLKDDSLTDADRAAIESDISRLKKDSETLDDKLHEAYVKKRGWEKEAAAAEAEGRGGDAMAASSAAAFFQGRADGVLAEMARQSETRTDMEQSARQERADLDAAQQKQALRKGGENAPLAQDAGGSDGQVLWAEELAIEERSTDALQIARGRDREQGDSRAAGKIK